MSNQYMLPTSPKVDNGILANPVCFASSKQLEGFQIIRDDFGDVQIYEVNRGVTEVGFDDDFESLTF